MPNTYTIDSKRFDKTFTYHSPNDTQIPRYQKLREKAKELSYLIGQLCPDSREKSLALTDVEQAVMWANKSIALEEE